MAKIQENENKIEKLEKSLLGKIGESFLINSGTLMSLGVFILAMRGFIELMKTVQDLPDGFRELGLIGAIAILLLSIKIPKLIGHHFE